VPPSTASKLPVAAGVVTGITVDEVIGVAVRLDVVVVVAAVVVLVGVVVVVLVVVVAASVEVVVVVVVLLVVVVVVVVVLVVVVVVVVVVVDGKVIGGISRTRSAAVHVSFRGKRMPDTCPRPMDVA